jgi:hypothetical protein
MFQPEHSDCAKIENRKWLILRVRGLAQAWIQRVSGSGNVYFRG